MNCAVENAWSLPPVLAREEFEQLEVMFIRIPFAADVERRHGVQAHRDLQDLLAQVLIATLGLTTRGYGVLRWPADDLVAWRVRGSDTTPCHEVQRRLVHAARSRLDDPNTANHLRVASVALDFAERCEQSRTRAFARALESARDAAGSPVTLALESSESLLDKALRDHAFRFHHQPIVDVASREVFAYESLCRGTLEGMQFPDLIFRTAERTQRLSEVGELLRKTLSAELDAPGIPPALQFMNIHPADLDDPYFIEHVTQGQMVRHAGNVVFELTERTTISDYPRVKEVFEILRAYGYRLAIDDLGSRHSGLSALADLAPDFIKFDMTLTRDLHEHPVKQRFVARIHDFATKIGARTISKGVECERERDAIISTGCTLMQGYFFARPGRGFATVNDARFGTAAWMRAAG